MRARFFGPDASTATITARLLRASSTASAPSTLDIRDRDGVDARVRRARRAHRARRPHGRAAVARLGGLRPAHRLRASTPTARSTCCRRRASTARTRRFVFTSTNKVYGDRPNFLPLEEPRHAARAARGPPLVRRHRHRRCRSTRAPHSLFGVSKAAADLLVQEYGRYFDMPTVCFRGGCLTGPQHAGAQLHGFLAYLMRCTVDGRAVHGLRLRRQAGARQHPLPRRRRARSRRSTRAPRPAAVYNLGGGRESNVSMLEAIDAVRADRRPRARLDAVRPGAHRRPPLVDLRPRRLPARPPGAGR